MTSCVAAWIAQWHCWASPTSVNRLEWNNFQDVRPTFSLPSRVQIDDYRNGRPNLTFIGHCDQTWVRHTTTLTIYKTSNTGLTGIIPYGHETWAVLVEDQLPLTGYGGVQIEDGAWRKRMNHELYYLGKPAMVYIVKIGRLRLTEHVQ